VTLAYMHECMKLRIQSPLRSTRILVTFCGLRLVLVIVVSERGRLASSPVENW
jgi:hypothetical protein